MHPSKLTLMRINTFFYLFLIMLCFSCVKESNNALLKSLNKNINLSNINAGQISKYIAYTAKCEDVDGTFKYTKDTLNVRIVEIEELLFIEESLTKNSTSFLSGEVIETFRYPLVLQKDRLVLTDRSLSRLFFFYDSDFLPLNFPALMPTAKQEGCRLNLGETPFVGNELVQFPSFEVGPIKLINKAAVSCRPISDGEGYLIYDSERLYMSHTITTFVLNGEIAEVLVNGWQLLED